MKEEKCIILDFLPHGYPDRRHAEPIAQALGTDFFTLLEIVPREDVNLQNEEEVYIGKDKRDKVKFIRGSIEYKDLTNMSKNALPEIVERIIKENEKRFINFFNTSHMITPRMHQIQLLPGIGKKHLVDILEERKKKPFETLQELGERVKLVPDPIKIVVKRVMMEIEGNEKYYLFTVPKRLISY
jgi:putative nucleotide binding protein